MSDRTPLIQILRKPPPPRSDFGQIAERLRQYRPPRFLPEERCELCGTGIEGEHGHVVNLPVRSLLCVCRACYLLFTHEGAGGARFRAVPQRYQLLPGFATASEEWEWLQIPIGLAFFFRNSATGRMTAFYPSPAGATESQLPLDAWDRVIRAVPPLETLLPDVEALLVRRQGLPLNGAPGPTHPQPEQDGPVVALIVPIDACYELVGRIRRSWRGFQGGDEAWREIDGFFARVIDRARASEVRSC